MPLCQFLISFESTWFRVRKSGLGFKGSGFDDSSNPLPLILCCFLLQGFELAILTQSEPACLRGSMSVSHLLTLCTVTNILLFLAAGLATPTQSEPACLHVNVSYPHFRHCHKSPAVSCCRALSWPPPHMRSQRQTTFAAALRATSANMAASAACRNPSHEQQRGIGPLTSVSASSCGRGPADMAASAACRNPSPDEQDCARFAAVGQGCVWVLPGGHAAADAVVQWVVYPAICGGVCSLQEFTLAVSSIAHPWWGPGFVRVLPHSC
jgi:hypothetical protein